MNTCPRILAVLIVLSVAGDALAQTNFYWTNTLGNVWSGEIWTNDTGAGLNAPAAGGENDYIINFSTTSGPFTSTNDLGTVANSGFLLNQLVFSNAPVTLTGSNLVFVSTGAGALPKILQNGASNIVINNNLTLLSSTVFGGGGGGTLTNSGNLSGTGALTKTGSYTLVLSGANSAYDGAITNRGPGRLMVASNTALGSTNAGTVLICNGTSGTGDLLQLGTGVSLTNESLTIVGSGSNRGALYSAGVASYVGTITLVSSAAAQLYADGTSATKLYVDGLITNAGTASLSLRGNSGTGTVAATIMLGVGTSLGKTDSSTWVITSTNNVWGNTAISTGTLKLGADNALPLATAVTLGQGSAGNTATLDLGGFKQTITGLSTAGDRTGNVWTVTSATAALLTINNSANYIYSGTVAKAVALLKTGTGRLTLAGTNTYTGDTTISNGVLLLAGTLAAPSSTVMVAVNSGLTFSGVTALAVGGLAGTGDFALTNDLGAGVTLSVGRNNVSTLYSGALSGAGGLVKMGAGTLTLAGNNTYSGGTVLSAGNLVFGSPSAIADATLTISNGTAMGTAYALDQAFLNRITPISSGTVALAVNSANDLDFNAANLTNVSLGAIAGTTDTYSGTLTPVNGLYRLGGGGGTLVVGSLLAGANALIAFSAGSGGNLMLSNNNTYTLGTTILTGTVTLGVANALPTDTALVLGDVANKTNAGTLDLNGFSQTIGSLATPRILAGGITNNATGTNAIINIAAGQALNVVTNTSGNVVSLAEGTRLQVSGAGALNILDTKGTVLIYGQRSSTTAMGLDLSQLGSFSANVNTLYVGYDTDNNQRQALLALAGTNTLTANKMYVGYSTQVGSLTGQVFLGVSNRLNVANLYVANNKGYGVMTFYPGLVNPQVTITGTTGVDRANIFVGEFGSANSGTQPTGFLMITNAGASISARLDQLLMGSLDVAGNATNSGAYGYFTFNNGSLDINSVILGQSKVAASTGTGLGVLTMGGGALLVNSNFTLALKLGGANTLVSGTFNLNGGTALVNADLLGGGGASTLNLNGGTLDLNGHNLGATGTGFISNVLVQAGTLQNVVELNGGTTPLTKTGSGLLVLDGNNTYTGGTTISNGTVQVGTGGTSGILGGGTVNNLGTLVFNRSDLLTLNNTLTGNGTLIQNGGGTVNLTGDGSAYGGSTFVSNGTLRANGTLGGLISVYTGGTLGGTGALNAVVINGGTLSPGNSPGIQLVASLTLNGGTLRAELVNSSSFDQVIVTNGLTFAAGTTNYLHLALTGFTSETGASYLIVRDDSASPWNGTSIFFLSDLSGDNGLALTNGMVFQAMGETATTNLFRISYDFVDSGDGVANDIVLTVIPEPTTLNLLVMLGVAYGLRRRQLANRQRRDN